MSLMDGKLFDIVQKVYIFDTSGVYTINYNTEAIMV